LTKAPKKVASGLKKLVIVESPAKARKIGDYLGDDFIFGIYLSAQLIFLKNIKASLGLKRASILKRTLHRCM
jgi:hypothetical protein